MLTPPPPSVLDHGRWATSDARTSTGIQMSPKFLKLEMRVHWQGIKFRQNSQNLSNYGPRTSHRCQDFRNFWEI